MTHLNIISFFCLLLFIYYILIMLKKSEQVRNTFLNVQLLIVLLYNIFIIIVFPFKVPVEFSTLSYFVVPFIALFNIKDLKLWSAFSALLSGAGYYVSMISFGTALYGNFPVYSVLTSLFNHGSLLAYAVITILTVDINKNDKYILAAGVAFNCFWALALRPFVLHPGRIFIYEILDANLVANILPNLQIIMVPVYFMISITIVYLIMKLMYVANNWYQSKEKYSQEKYIAA